LRGQRPNNSSKWKETTQEQRTRSLGMRETTKANSMSRSPKIWATVRHNRDKNAWSLKKRHKGLNTNHVIIENTSPPPAPQEEAKGLNTTGTRAQNSQAPPKHMN
jgi:hypothetical protein